MKRSFKIHVVALAAMLFAPARAAEQSVAPNVTVFSTAHLWQANLDIGDAPHWDGKSRLMTISPTSKSATYYVPKSLRDAWRELAHALPPNYTSLAASLSAHSCLKDATGEVISLHNALADYGYENWISPKQSPYREYLVRRFDFVPPNSATATEYDREVGKIAMAWTLCYFYMQENKPGSFDMATAEADLKQQLEQLRAKRSQHLH
jgi:hypothetical protein